MPQLEIQTLAERVSAWSSKVQVSMQGDDDNACGLHCFATAAVHLKTIDPTLRSPLDQISARLVHVGLFEDRGRGPQKPTGRTTPTRYPELFTRGLWHHDVPAVANACGLQATKTDDVLRALHDGGPVLAYLAVTSVVDPRGSDADPFTHYALALEHIPGNGDDRGWIVLADPHPWQPLRVTRSTETDTQVYAVPTEHFVKAWSASLEWEQISNVDHRGKEAAWSLAALR